MTYDLIKQENVFDEGDVWYTYLVPGTTESYFQIWDTKEGVIKHLEDLKRKKELKNKFKVTKLNTVEI